MDYFTVKQQYYTGNYKQSLQEIAKHNKIQDDTLFFYRAKCCLALGQYEKLSGQTRLGDIFDAYVDFLSSKDLSKLEASIGEAPSPFALHLLASGQSILGQYDESLNTCVQGIGSDEEVGTPELLLLCIQVALLNGQPSIATTMLQNYVSANESYSSDNEIIINLAESYINFATNKETTRSNFYFYEELCQTFPSWKTQLSLLNLHLQQSHIPEAQSIIELLESEYYQQQKESAQLYAKDFLSAKITLTIMNGGKVDELRDQLFELAPDHPLCKAHKENNAKFDEIVAKYSA